MKRINELFDVEEDFKVEAIYSDSRDVTKNSIFFCIEGLRVDGHRYIEDAIFQGAICVVYSKPLSYKHRDVLYIHVDDVMAELNRVADIFYDNPSYKMSMIGITGTSGKTVVALMIRDILSRFLKMGYIGSNDIRYDGKIIQCPYTTPETIFLHKNLNEMVKADVKGVCLEVSSHGLALHRVDSVHFNIGVFTNLYEEHLDFHGTMDRLMASKEMLFEMLDENGYAILNTDSVKFYVDVMDKTKAHIITYGIDHKSDVMARNIELFVDHTEFDLQYKDDLYPISVPLLARFNVSNVLAVVATLLALEMPITQIVELIGSLRRVDGRMEYIANPYGLHIIIDNCQNTESYKQVFEFARSVCKKGRIIGVFGIAGKRNDHRRQVIGKLANEYLDHVILTAEDVRDDNIYEICEDIQQYLVNPVSVIFEDRSTAIEQAIEIANRNDIILILGKGHEKFMASTIGSEPYLGDKYVALNAINEIFKQGGEDENEL